MHYSLLQMKPHHVSETGIRVHDFPEMKPIPVLASAFLSPFYFIPNTCVQVTGQRSASEDRDR